MRVCVPTPEAINNQWHDIDQLVKQVLWLFSAFQLHYKTLVIDKMDRHYLSNMACRETCQEDQSNAALATEEILNKSNNMECFSYKGGQINT